MIKIFVSIDKKSIKKNPNYGKDRIQISSTIDCKIKSPEKIDWLVEPGISVISDDVTFTYDYLKEVKPDYDILKFIKEIEKTFGEKTIKNIIVKDNYIDVAPDNGEYLYKYKKFICPVCNILCSQIYNENVCEYCGNYLGSGYYACSKCGIKFDEVEFEDIDNIKK